MQADRDCNRAGRLSTTTDIAIALDPAASSFHDGSYNPERSGQGRNTSAELIELYQDWVRKFPIVSIEDGLAETDWDGFRRLTTELGERIQIGTVSETIAAIELCRKVGWSYVISHRSGETEDTFIADFAVAMAGGQIKAGSLCRGERIAKYNRLLEIEWQLGSTAVFGNPLVQRHA